MLGLLLVSMMVFLPNMAHAYTYADYNTAIGKTADRLVALQSVSPGPPTPADYGWDWIVTGLTSHSVSSSATNVYGVTALGLIDAYSITANAAYYAAAKNTADFIKYGDPAAGDFWNGMPPYTTYYWGYSFDYKFLMQFSATSGDTSYETYALAAWAWQKANIAYYADGSQAAAYSHFVANGGGSDGYGGWQSSDYGLAAYEMGDTAWAQNMASVISGNIALVGGAATYKDLGMAWALKLLVTVDPVTYASGIATLKASLEADQLPSGSWHDGNPEGDAQTTAYAVMALWTAGELTIARKGADWLVQNQMTNGGWSASPDEYSETDSEAMQAIFTAVASANVLYINPAAVNKTPSDVGTTFTQAVTLSNFADLMGFDINLTWDNSLITFVSADKTSLDTLWGAGHWTTVIEPSGAGYYELAALSTATAASNTGASVLFTLTFEVAKSSNFLLSTPIHFALVKLSDNATPVPNPIIPATVNDGMYSMSAIQPGLEFKVEKYNNKTLGWDPVSAPYRFERGNNFTVDIYVTGISANSPLQDYDVKIAFDTTLATYQNVFAWGIFGTGTVDTTTPGVVHVSGSGLGWSGPEGLLFQLKFQVNFTAIPAHIWKYGSLSSATFSISIADVTLSFGSLGTIPMGGITLPSALSIEVDFIRGDVTCDGVVSMADISSVAYYYGQAVPPGPAQYDLTNNNFIDIYDIVTIATNYGYGMDP